MKALLSFLNDLRNRRLGTLVAGAAVAAALGGCGGGDGGSTPATPSRTLGGTAAVGAPIVGGAVAVSCAGGSGLTTTTTATGSWSVSLSGQTLPCAVQVSGGTVGGAASTVTLHSIALAIGTVNITPLTDLAMARLVAASPSSWFASPSFTGIDAAAVNAAVQSLTTSLGLGSALGTSNPFTSAFQPVAGDPIDDLLEAIRTVLGQLSSDYAALLSAAASGNFSAYAGFGGAVSVALGGSASCTAGTAMTYTQGAAGAPFSNGQTVCFEASTTQLAFPGKTLGNPVRNTAVLAPYAAYVFADGALSYEVVFNGSALYEINVSGSAYLGQFSLANPGGGTGGTSSLLVDVAIGGSPAASITIDNVPAPANEAEFCGSIQNDSTFASIGAQGGGTLTVRSCSFSNNVGTIDATLSVSGFVVNYRVTYRYV